MRYFNHNSTLMLLICRLSVSGTLATDTLTLKNRTMNAITVSFVQGVFSSHLVARNRKYIRNTGLCETTTKLCTVSGLPPGEEFEIWMRHCDNQMHCSLDAKPLNVSTKPAREETYLFILTLSIQYSTLSINSNIPF